jgi:hypothetical protein
MRKTNRKTKMDSKKTWGGGREGRKKEKRKKYWYGSKELMMIA